MAVAPFAPPERLLLGPGPSNVPATVLEAQARPCIGHMDPAFSAMMEEVKAMLRAAFRTDNPATFPLSAPGSMAMEAALANLLEPGDQAIVLKNGVFGGRMAEIVRRCGAEPVEVDFRWGEAIDPGRAEEAMLAHPEAKLVAFVHAETSTGALSDAARLCALAREAGMLSVVDCVTSLGGVPVEVDAWGADVAYAGTQKCLSAPPGLAPITFSPAAVRVVEGRTTPVQSWFADLSLILGYWTGGAAAAGAARTYHHTAPVNALYALHEALRGLTEEGLAARHARHARAAARLMQGLEGLGLAPATTAMARMPQLTMVEIPQGIDDAAFRRAMLDRHGIEIGAGLGPLAGRVWRIGLMGENARDAVVDRLLDALEAELVAAARPKPAADALPAVAAE